MTTEDTKAIDEVLRDVTDAPRTGLESPMSITTTAYYKGFSMMITKRDSTAKILPLLEKQIELVDWLVEHDFKPSWNEDTNKAHLTPESIPTMPCVFHGESMIKAFSKKTNKDYWYHKSPDGQMCFGDGYKIKK